MSSICNTCNIEIDENNYFKHRTVCKGCYNENRGKNNNNTITQNQQPKIDKINNKNDNTLSVSAYENHAHVVIGKKKRLARLFICSKR